LSIFKEHKRSGDRSAADRSRHKKKIEKAIKEGIHHIVSEESIIGQDGKKKIKIPVRGIKEYRFVYGDNESNKKVGSAPGKDIKKGQIIKSNKKSQKEGGKASDAVGEEFYEVEITLKELASYLFDNLNLPEIEKKKLKNIIGEKLKRSGYRSKGIRPRLSKKETLKNKIKRKKAAERVETYDPESDERFPFHESDLKYKHIKSTPKENSNAVIFFMMDTSGSMTKDKKFMARSFFFLLFHFLNYKYNNVELVFISHDVEAREVTEDQFFGRGSSGGTLMSSALSLCLDIIDKRFHPTSWNVYAFHCSDGDNWPSDNESSVNLSIQLKDICQMYCYTEIIPSKDERLMSTSFSSQMSGVYGSITDEKFKIVNINDPEDIWPQFKKIFGGKLDV
jgi:sporulation protein YhbH